MSEDGKRPGGLTALAVINFVFSGFLALAIVGFIMILSGAAGHTDEVQHALGILWVIVILLGLEFALLLLSGIGYLQQKKLMGRVLGTVYALLSLVGTAVSFADPANKFNMTSMIGLIYPVLTLILLNTTFKDDLVR